MATWIDFKELRSRLRFEAILRQYGIAAKINGDRATCCCPLPGHPSRNDGTPRTASLSVNLTRNIFQCFGCKASGNALEFACRMEGFDPADPQQFRTAALKVAEVFGFQGRRPRPESHARSQYDLPLAPPERRASPSPVKQSPIINAPLDFQLKDLDSGHPYLHERGFTPETIEYFGLGYCNRGMLRGRVAIPLHDAKGRLVGYAGRMTKDSMISDACPKYLFPGDRERNGQIHHFRKSHLLYNAHRIMAPVDHLVVVEGLPATWWCYQAEYHNTVALMGSSCSLEQAKLIVDLVKSDGKVWLMPDGDQAGVLCARSALERISPYRFVRWARLRENEQPTYFSVDELAGFFQN